MSSCNLAKNYSKEKRCVLVYTVFSYLQCTITVCLRVRCSAPVSWLRSNRAILFIFSNLAHMSYSLFTHISCSQHVLGFGVMSFCLECYTVVTDNFSFHSNRPESDHIQLSLYPRRRRFKTLCTSGQHSDYVVWIEIGRGQRRVFAVRWQGRAAIALFVSPSRFSLWRRHVQTTFAFHSLVIQWRTSYTSEAVGYRKFGISFAFTE